MATNQLLDGSKLFLFPHNRDFADEGDEDQTQGIVNHVVNIQTYDGKSCVVFLDEDMTTHSLKREISSQVSDDENVARSRIFYNGFELPDTLLLCSIVTPHSTLFLLPSVTELVSFFLVSVSRRTSLTASGATSIKSLKDDVCQLMVFLKIFQKKQLSNGIIKSFKTLNPSALVESNARLKSVLLFEIPNPSFMNLFVSVLKAMTSAQ